MSKKFLSLFLTLVTLLAAAPMRASAARELTEDDDREARELAVRFVKRLRETDDFAQPVAEFFPEDFEERVKQFMREMPESVERDVGGLPCDRALLLRSEAGVIRRAYVALMNFWNQQELLRDAAWKYVVVEYRAAGKDALGDYEEARSRSKELAEKAVPEEAFRVAASDPFLEVMFRLVRADGDEEGEEDSDEEKAEEKKAKFEAAYIRDDARLRSFIERLERCVALLRKGVERLRSDASSLAASHGLTKDSPAKDEFKVYSLEEDTLEVAAFGLPARATLIHARISPYELPMTRDEGRLRILAVYPDFDGD